MDFTEFYRVYNGYVRTPGGSARIMGLIVSTLD